VKGLTRIGESEHAAHKPLITSVIVARVRFRALTFTHVRFFLKIVIEPPTTRSICRLPLNTRSLNEKRFSMSLDQKNDESDVQETTESVGHRYVNFGGDRFKLAGCLPKIDALAPEFTVYSWFNGRRIEITLGDLLAEKKPLLISTFASHDTPVSRMHVKTLDMRLSPFRQRAIALQVSSDLPFTINRAFRNEELTSFVGASDYYDRNFGKAYGVLLEDPAVLARAIFVIDGEGILRHYQLQTDITAEPDYDLAIATIAWLISRSDATDDQLHPSASSSVGEDSDDEVANA
jgi:thiol peroxidase